MRTPYKILGLSLFLSLSTFTQASDSLSLHKAVTNDQNIIVADKKTPIGKALSQQKRDRLDKKLKANNDQIKMLTSMSNSPTQNFLAEQHQHFSRIFQALFQPHSS